MASTGRRLGLVLAVIAALVLVVTGVMLASDDAAAPDSGGRLAFALEDYGLDPSEAVLPVGEPLVLVFVNRSDFTHHLAFARVAEGGGEPAAAGDADLLLGLDAEVDPASAWIDPTPSVDHVTLDVAAGSTVTLEVTLPADRVGEWEVGCFVGARCTSPNQVAGTLRVE